MTKEKTFSEMLYGDIRWMKQQEAIRRMHRLGKTEMVVLDAEAGISRMTPSHYTTHQMLVNSITAGMGYGSGLYNKRKMLSDRKVVAEINKRHPALAAEQRVAGVKAERSIALEMKSLRDWKKMNWGFYYGSGRQDRFDQDAVMKLTGPVFTDGAL